MLVILGVADMGGVLMSVQIRVIGPHAEAVRAMYAIGTVLAATEVTEYDERELGVVCVVAEAEITTQTLTRAVLSSGQPVGDDEQVVEAAVPVGGEEVLLHPGGQR
jgi:hypothetical protein